jgi:hypothetical protein
VHAQTEDKSNYKKEILLDIKVKLGTEDIFKLIIGNEFT